MGILVTRPPPVAFGVMGVWIVQDDVHPPLRMFGGDAVHEMQF
jgi:hypothetical protein